MFKNYTNVLPFKWYLANHRSYVDKGSVRVANFRLHLSQGHGACKAYGQNVENMSEN